MTAPALKALRQAHARWATAAPGDRLEAWRWLKSARRHYLRAAAMYAADPRYPRLPPVHEAIG
jgi:hypothetical protein